MCWGCVLCLILISSVAITTPLMSDSHLMCRLPSLINVLKMLNNCLFKDAALWYSSSLEATFYVYSVHELWMLFVNVFTVHVVFSLFCYHYRVRFTYRWCTLVSSLSSNLFMCMLLNHFVLCFYHVALLYVVYWYVLFSNIFLSCQFFWLIKIRSFWVCILLPFYS